MQVLTKDSVTIMVDAVVFYRIFNPIVTVVKVDNANQATQMLAQTTLRNMLGTKSLTEILTDREEMAELMSVSIEHILMSIEELFPEGIRPHEHDRFCA